MIFAALVALLVGGFSTAYLSSGEVRYLWRAGYEETRILQSRQPIEKLARDSTLPVARRDQLRLVLDARAYAARLGFEAGDTYTTFADVGRDTLLLVLSASPRNCICPHTWKYPIVGKVPYKGFFNLEQARATASEFDARGFDTYLRPAGAFSTLGWFEDPLLSTALTRDSVELAALVFHEIAHNSLYVKSATEFNESFAQLAGYRAAEQFFRERGDSVNAASAAARWLDEIVLGNFYTELVGRLTAFYGTKPDSAALDSGRVAIGLWARDQLEGPVAAQLHKMKVSKRPGGPVNNARLVGALIYRTKLQLFEDWYERYGANIAESVRALRELEAGAEGKGAYERLEKALAP
ncbi:MAG: aminopeptidase [Gemmatimonadetes bacterium]|nr:aminopeptidase [Gemmatimonadota bacterium]